MERGNGGPWLGWLTSLLLGAALALFCMLLLGRSTAPEPSCDTAVQPQRSVGFEFTLRLRFLLPDKAAEN